jgi:hypothetical protein
MCLSVFIASDSELPLVEWNVERPGFNVSVLIPGEESVRKWLQRPYVYTLGAHTHCGCGFQRNEDNAPEDVAASRQALSEYVAAASRRGPVDLYVCWNAEVMDELTGEGTLQAAALVTDESWIQEGALTHVVGQ